MNKTLRRKYCALTAGSVAAVALSASVHATDYNVTTLEDVVNDNDMVTSLREAVIAANTNTAAGSFLFPVAAGEQDTDSISFSVAGTITLTEGPLPIADDLSIDGNNAITISGGDASRIFTVDTTAGVGANKLVKLSNITLTNGLAAATESDEGNGGAITIAADSVLLLQSVTISDSISQADAAGEGGGAIFTAGSLTITDGSLESNSVSGAAGNGGAIFVADGGSLTATGTSFTSNSAKRAGGALEVSANSTVQLTDVSMTDNLAGTNTDGVITGAPGNGGAIHTTGGTTSINGGFFTDNTAAREGGALWNNGPATMTIAASEAGGTSITANSALGGLSTEDDAVKTTRGGGGVFNRGTMTIADAIIDGNDASGELGNGGGVMNIIVPDSTDPADLSIANSSILNNTANRAGGGIENQGGGSITITTSAIENNAVGTAPGNGGGLHSAGGSITITGDPDATPTPVLSTITGNTAGSEGAGLWASGNLTVSDTTIDANIASGDAADNGGGGIFMNGASSVLVISDSIITNNVADGEKGSGGGIFNAGGTMTITDLVISTNTANRAGGGIEDLNTLGTTITTVTMENNSVNGDGAAPGNGGAIHVSGTGNLSCTSCTVNNNLAANEGGGFWAGGSGASMTITDSMFDSNLANGTESHDGGGAVFNNGGSLTISGSTFESNAASIGSGSGGAILNMGGITTISESTFTANISARAGGAIEDNSAGISGSDAEADRDPSQTDVDITNSVFTMNTTGASPGNGGAIHITGNGVMDIVGSTFNENTAANEGGALWNFASSIMTVSNSTLSANTAVDGGGLFLQPQEETTEGSVQLNSVTIAANTGSTQGGGISVADGGVISAVNTLIADNTSPLGPDVNGAISANFSLFGDDTGATITGSDNVTNEDPLLEALGANGASQGQTHALVSGPAVDAGSNTDCELDPVANVDQRGETRPADGNASGEAVCDIGAFELTDNLTLAVDDNDAAETATAANGDTDVAAITFGVNNTTGDTLTVSKLSGKLNGTLDLALGVAAIKVHLDVNGDGALDAGDTEIAATIIKDDTMRTYEIEFTTPRSIADGVTENYLITVDLTADASTASMWLFAPLLLLSGLFARSKAKLVLVAGAMTALLSSCGGGGGGANTVLEEGLPSNTIQFTIDTLTIVDSGGKAVIPTGLPKEGTVITVE